MVFSYHPGFFSRFVPYIYIYKYLTNLIHKPFIKKQRERETERDRDRERDRERDRYESQKVMQNESQFSNIFEKTGGFFCIVVQCNCC